MMTLNRRLTQDAFGLGFKQLSRETTNNATNFSSVLKSNLFSPSCWNCRIISTTSKLQKNKKDFQYEEKMPIFEYNKINTVRKRMYVFGTAYNGAIGLENMVRPKEEGMKAKLFSWNPVRHRFAEVHDITDVATGHGFTLIATKPRVDNGPIVFGCGNNVTSQLGFQAMRKDGPLETLLSIVPLPITGKRSSKVLAIGAGSGHSIISIQGEGLYTLGDNSCGQCGRAIIENEKYFGSKYRHQLTKFKEDEVIFIASRFALSVCVTQSGKVYTFGSNQKGQLGRGKIVSNEWQPEPVQGDLEGEKVIKVATSGSSVLALTDNGELFVWGCNELGQINYNELSTMIYQPKHIQLPQNIGKVIDIAIGDFFSFVLNEQGDVYVWGYGNTLGLGPKVKTVRIPTLIPPPLFGQNKFSSNVQVASIASSFFYASAINSNGDMFTWGKDSSGCLGLGKMRHQYFPLKVALGAAAQKISLGIDHSIVIAKGGL